MTTSRERINYLLEAYANRTHTRPELDELLEYIRQAKDDDSIYALIEQRYHAHQSGSPLPDLDWDFMFQQITRKEEPVQSGRRIHLLRKWQYAAAVIVLLCAGGYFWYKQSISPVTVPVISQADVTPGGNKAILTLADGSQIILDSTTNGNIAKEGNTLITRSKTGELIYQDAAPTNQGGSRLNTLTTPRGGQHQLNLPDGSKVWLNAASSIKYPVAFNGKERKVEITGEAYFEVAKDTHKPFRVIAGEQEVEALGTSFNVNTYDDEPLKKTTLLTGSVRVTRNTNSHKQEIVLSPFQQAVVSSSDNTIRKITVQTDDAIAWKSGFIHFTDVKLEEIMRQLARWYDIEVVYEKDIPDIVFEGKMGRGVGLSKVLTFFEESGVRFRLEGNKKLIILNQHKKQTI